MMLEEDDQKEEAEGKTFGLRLWEASLGSMIPDTEQFESNYRWVAGTAYFLLLFALFIIFFILGFLESQRSTFLTNLPEDENLQKNPQASSPYCNLVPLTVASGSFLADRYGNWETDPKFNASEGIFSLTVVNYAMSFNEYRTYMLAIYDDLYADAMKLNLHDLAYQAVFWSSNYYFPFPSSSQRFTYSGNPLVFFNRAFNQGRLASVNGSCDVASSTSYSYGDGSIYLTFDDMSQFTQNPKCTAAMWPQAFDWNPEDRYSHSLKLMFDVRTLMAAMSVNMQINNLSAFTEAPSVLNTFIVNITQVNTVAKLSEYYDPLYPGMDTFACLSYVSGEYNFQQAACFLHIGSVYGIPTFNHLGESVTEPKFCNCKETGNPAITSIEGACNIFRFLSGFLFWRNDNTTDLLYSPYAEVVSMILKYVKVYGPDAMPAINAAAFNMTFRVAMGSNDSQALTDPASYDFCKLPSGQLCSIVAFASYDQSFRSPRFVSDNYHSVLNGSCFANNVVVSREEWDIFCSNSFSNLVQSYEVCTDTLFTSVFNQMGIAMGNMGLFAPFLFYLILWSSTYFAVIKEKDEAEKEAVREGEGDEVRDGNGSYRTLVTYHSEEIKTTSNPAGHGTIERSDHKKEQARAALRWLEEQQMKQQV